MLFAAFFPFTGGLGEASAVPQGRTGSPRGGVLGRARISFQYARSLRPCLAPPIAPLRRATFRQTLPGALALAGLHRRGCVRSGAGRGGEGGIRTRDPAFTGYAISS